MRKRTTTAIVCILAVGASVAGYITADVYNIVPGIVTNVAPPQAAPLPERENVQLPGFEIERMRLDLPPVTRDSVAPAWEQLRADLASHHRVGAVVIDALTGNVVLDESGDTPLIPASLTKVLTAFSMAHSLPLTERLATRVWLDADNRLHLVGDGDLLLSDGAGDSRAVEGRAGLDDLADQVAHSLQSLAAAGSSSESSPVDESQLIYHPRIADGATREETLDPDVVRWVGHSVAFAVDGGRVESSEGALYDDDPAGHVAQLLVARLADRGITVSAIADDSPFDDSQGVRRIDGDDTYEGTQGDGAKGQPDTRPVEIARVESATIGEVTRLMLRESDNTLAEHLCRLSAVRDGSPSDVASAASHVVARMGEAGVDVGGTRMSDCSGLNDGNRIAPMTLARVLSAEWSSDEPHLRSLIRDLPIGWFTGTLTYRMGDPYAGRIQMKTGSLGTASGLAGTVTTAEGRALIVVVEVETGEGEAWSVRPALDSFVQALAAI